MKFLNQVMVLLPSTSDNPERKLAPERKRKITISEGAPEVGNMEEGELYFELE